MTMTRKLREQATRQLRVELAFSQPANAIGLQRRREEGEGEKEKIYMIKSNQTTSWSPPFQTCGVSGVLFPAPPGPLGIVLNLESGSRVNNVKPESTMFGRIHKDDRLVEVNGQDVSEKTSTEIKGIFRGLSGEAPTSVVVLRRYPIPQPTMNMFVTPAQRCFPLAIVEYDHLVECLPTQKKLTNLTQMEWEQTIVGRRSFTTAFCKSILGVSFGSPVKPQTKKADVVPLLAGRFKKNPGWRTEALGLFIKRDLTRTLLLRTKDRTATPNRRKRGLAVL